MTCDALFSQMGFECWQRSPGVYRVFTPLSFPDGEPVGLYFEQIGNVAKLSDNADTLFHLRSMGIDIGSRWRSLSRLVGSFGMKLERSGEITAASSIAAAPGLVARFLAAMISVGDFERDVMNTPPELTQYIDEVEGYLRQWRPSDKLVRNFFITGHSGREHVFHFRLADDLVEAARPRSQRTGAILRKAADVHNSEAKNRILVVMDDRDDPDGAKIETDILSTMTSVLPVSRLIGNLSGAPPAQMH